MTNEDVTPNATKRYNGREIMLQGAGKRVKNIRLTMKTCGN